MEPTVQTDRTIRNNELTILGKNKNKKLTDAAHLGNRNIIPA
jgi:hypothetical protein